jgi:Zn finger protein HypA/HybF involved in hydrogenase expression
MPKHRVTQHKPERESQRAREVADLKREVHHLKRQVARLRKRLAEVLDAEEEAIEESPLVEPEQLELPLEKAVCACGGTGTTSVVTPKRTYIYCSQCRARLPDSV